MWLIHAIKQLNLFPEQDFSLPPEEQRKRDLQFLPGIHENYMIGPLYHGSPHAKAILNDPSYTGLATDKIPMFGGVNTPMHSGLYFGTVPDIAEAYSVGDVNGAMYYEVINEIDEILDTINWTEEDIRNATDDDYYKFERDMENKLYEGSDAFSFAPYQIANIIWNYIRSNAKNIDNSGVISFKHPVSNILPDEDSIYNLVQWGPSSLRASRINLEKIADPKYVEEFYKKTLKHMATDFEQYILETVPEFKDEIEIAKVESEDIYDLVDKLIEIMKKRYYDEDGNVDMNMMSSEFMDLEDEDTALIMQVIDDVFNALGYDVIRALGIMSIGSVGKGAVPPIKKEKFPEHNVQLWTREQ